MPGNAFQRNAFQRNAFQIVYDFVPTSSGGGVGGGSVTAVFTPAENHYTPISTGGGVGGGNVVAVFTPVQVVRPGPGPGPDRRPWRVITRFFKHPKHYKPRTSGGAVVGGSVRAEQFKMPPELVYLLDEPVPIVFQPTVGGGIVAGGSVRSVHRWALPPPDNRIQFSYEPTEPVVYSPSSSGGGKSFGGSAVAIFKRAPALIDYRVARLRKQIEEEDELLLLGALDE